MAAELKRCFWVSLDKPYYVEYHDTEWGVPVHDDQRHFEMLLLEGAQAGLSWETILRKRENYRKAFAGFDPIKVARFTPARIEKLLLDPGLVRNRLKIESAVKNARAFLAILVFLVHARLWTFLLAIAVMLLFWVLERRGLTFEASLRAFRSWVLGKKRPANRRSTRRRWIDFG